MAGIYIHIPFCKQACHYCDFHFSTVKKLKDEVMAAIVKEIDLQKNYLKGSEYHTVYFGGGTPSLLELRDLEIIFGALHREFKIAENAEITLEANPDDLSLSKLQGLASLGVNRLSIGIQTFHNAYLKYLNRAHDAEMAIKSVDNARNAGFQNISIDLIYAIKEEGHQVLLSDLETVRSLEPEHVSAYCLTIEPLTAFGNWLRKKKITPIHEEFAAREFEILIESLSGQGYEQYEISNFAKPDKYSRHNSNYWKKIPYLGLGPSAHSFDGSSRQFNIPNNAKYIKSIAQGMVPFDREELTVKDQVNELVMTGLRTCWGCDLSELKKYGYDLLASNHKTLEKYQSSGWVEMRENVIKLTKSGRLLADEIAAELFWV